MNKIPLPSEIGLPAKYNQWRRGQEDGIQFMLESEKRISVLAAPTGWGKQGAVLAFAKLSEKATCIVTASRGLQDQYVREGKALGLVDLRGKNNYPCNMRADYTCEEGSHARCPYKGSMACPASQAETRASISNLVVTNYSKWCHSKRYSSGMAHFEQVIFDECHEMPEALAQVMQVVLGDREIEEDLLMQFPPRAEAENMVAWKPWAQKARLVAEVALIAARNKIDCAKPKPSWVKNYIHIRNLNRKLNVLAAASVKDWVVDDSSDRKYPGYQFDPIRPGKYAEAALLLKVPRIVCISATVRPKTMYLTGIKKDTFDFIEFDSDFDPNRCPMYYIPTQRVDARHPDIKVLLNCLDRIISRRLDRKGIIQSVSFDRQQQVEISSRHRNRFILNHKGEAPTEKIEQFRDSGPGTYLVSPSVGQGYDFPDDQCRMQFLMKIPFDPPSKVLKAREEADKDYRGYRAVNKVVQMFGRHIRSKEDWGEGFIADMNLDWFWPRYRHFAPKSFHNFFREVQVLPPPLSI